ncbi:MAG: O-antigen ligase family protein, partial [Asticcacaulis sp.]|nr:O-antigen ligase family protein [Asticcacaulis sp.]
FAAVIWLFPQKKADQRLAQPALGLLAMIFVVLCAVLAIEPLFGSPSVFDLSAFITAFLKLLGLACAFMAGLRLCSDNDNARRILDAVLLGGALWAGAAIIMQVVDPFAIYGTAKVGDPRRLAGAFTSPNSAATLFGSLAVLTWGRTLSRFINSDRYGFFERVDPIYAFEFAVCMMALIMSLSRSGWLATAAALTGLTLILFRKRISLPVFAGALVGVVAAVGLVMQLSSFTMVDRLVKLQSDIDTRQMLFSAHAAAGLKHPWTGWGFGSFITINNDVVTADSYPALWPVRAAHNVYLQWFEETGVAGLGALIILNLAVLGTVLAGALKKKRMGDRLWAMLFAYLVFLVHGLTDYAFQETSLSLYMAVVLGAGFAMATRSERDAPAAAVRTRTRTPSRSSRAA